MHTRSRLKCQRRRNRRCRFVQQQQREGPEVVVQVANIFSKDEEKQKLDSAEEIKGYLDQYVIGQEDAKRGISIALRNRDRLNALGEEDKKEIMPKNVLMIGPTGVGKSEIARRCAKATDAPYLKVEATSYTQIGYRGRDVSSMIDDLIRLTLPGEVNKFVKKKYYERKTDEGAMFGIADVLLGDTHDMLTKRQREFLHNFSPFIENIPVLVKDSTGNYQLGSTIGELSLERAVTNMQMHDSEVVKNCIKRVEDEGIIFIDEIDKLCGSGQESVADEGVQRDLLPIIEGTRVDTSIGSVDTNRILFITAGAFHNSKPTDLLSELQGRLPVRINLQSLSSEDLYKILTVPKYNLIAQYKALFETEGVDLRFTDESLHEIVNIALQINEMVEDIGARRLGTIFEKVLEDYSFEADEHKGKTLIIDPEYIREKIKPLMEQINTAKYIL